MTPPREPVIDIVSAIRLIDAGCRGHFDAAIVTFLSPSDGAHPLWWGASVDLVLGGHSIGIMVDCYPFAPEEPWVMGLAARALCAIRQLQALPYPGPPERLPLDTDRQIVLDFRAPYGQSSTLPVTLAANSSVARSSR